MSVKTRYDHTISKLTVVGGILLAGDHGLWVEEGAEGTRPNFVNHIRLKIDVERSRDVLARGRLGEESAEAFISATLHGTRGEAAVRL